MKIFMNEVNIHNSADGNYYCQVRSSIAVKLSGSKQEQIVRLM